jgi:tetratricopeptide (TPR) repeat protein
MTKLQEKSKGMILTDDYAPVENLLAPVALQDADEQLDSVREMKARKLADQLEKLAWAGDLSASLAKLDELTATAPLVAVRAYFVAASIFADSGKVNEALEIYQHAIDRIGKGQFDDQMTAIHYNFAALLKKAGRSEKAAEQFRLAIDGYLNILAKNPQSIDAYMHLGDISAENNNFEDAVKYFQKAVNLKPGDFDNNLTLIQAFEAQGQLDAAIEAAQKAVEYLSSSGQQEKAAKMQQYMDFIEFKKTRPKNQ